MAEKITDLSRAGGQLRPLFPDGKKNKNLSVFVTKNVWGKFFDDVTKNIFF